jgi:hypothetical protein
MTIYLDEVLADAPVLLLEFDETSGTSAADSSGNGRTFTWSGTPTLGEPALFPNSGGRSVRLSGDDYATITDAYFNSTAIFGAWTIEAWVTFRGSIPTVSPTLVSNERTTGGIPLDMGFNVGGGGSQKWGVGYYNGSWHSVHWATTPSLDTRYHFVGTWDGSYLRLRVNGVEVAVSAEKTAGPTASNSNNLRIGRKYDGADYLNAHVDAFAIYDYRLPDARADAHYASGLEADGQAAFSAQSALVAVPDGTPLIYEGSASLSAQTNTSELDVLARDDFERASVASGVGNPLRGPAPTVLGAGTWGIADRKIYMSAGGEGQVVWDVGVADVDISATLGLRVATGGLVVRAQDTNNFWLWQVDTTSSMILWKRSGGTYTSLVTRSGLTIAEGSVLRVIAVGPYIRGYLNGELLVTRLDGNFQTATKHGFRAVNSRNRFDDLLIRSGNTELDDATGEMYDVRFDADANTTGFVYKGRDSAALDSPGSAP